MRTLKDKALHEDHRRWLALAIVCLGQVMLILDATIVNVALPSIQRDLHMSQTALTWVVDAYLIAFGSFLLLAGRLGDLIGRKHVFLAGIALFTLASLLCGASGTSGMLIGGRFLQGIGAAVTASTVLALIVVEFPEPHDRARAMSAYTFVSVAGGTVGLLLGGILTELLSWHWIFLVNLPIGVLALAAGQRLLHTDHDMPGIGRDIDVLGSLLMTGTAMVGIYAIVQSHEHGIGSGRTLVLAAITGVLGTVFVLLESRIDNPIFPLGILRNRNLTASSVVRGLLVTGMYASFFLGALYLERVRGFGPVATGAAFMPQTVTVAIFSLGLTARLARRFGNRNILLVGLAIMCAGLALLTTVDATTAYFPTLFLAYAIAGIGAGMSFLTLVTLGVADVRPQEAGLASGIVNVSVQIAGAVGLAVLTTVAANRTQTLSGRGEPLGQALVGGYHVAFIVAAASTVLAFVAAALLLKPTAKPPAAAAPAAGTPVKETEAQPA